VTTDLFTRHAVIDVDTHITEPPDIFTSRVPKKWGDAVPHVERIDDYDVWMADGDRIARVGITATAGFQGVWPEIPHGFEDIPSASHDIEARLAHMDDMGVHAEVLFPNVAGFGNGYFLRLGDRELVAQCVRAYNDWLHEFTSQAPDRLYGVIATPFWDVDFAVEEIRRNAARGFRAVNFCNQPNSYGSPPLFSKHWDPIWAVSQEVGLPVTFHIGGGDMGGPITEHGEMGMRAQAAKMSSLIFMDNQRCLAELIFGGVCARFPDLQLISVESGIGWIPALLETFDWQWGNGGITDEHPEYDLLPSEYFRRQIYGCFWFERESALDAIRRYPDNFLYETDYPHPTCQHPGPATIAQYPRDYANQALGSLPDELVAKVLHDNAARVFKVG
jgi:predicted TIM-barrel fold metal-dependent hydrolase